MAAATERKPDTLGTYSLETARKCKCPAVAHPRSGYQADPIWIVNPLDVSDPEGNRYYSRNDNRVILFSFGAYGSTFLAVVGQSFEDALETAAGWLADNAPGHIMAHDSEDLAELWRDAYHDITGKDAASVVWDEIDDDLNEQVRDAAEADLTYTESGYLTSYEWTANELDPGDPLAHKIIRKCMDAYRKHYGENPR